MGAFFKANSRSGVRRSRGFTMMELMVVVAIILVLIGMAAGRYERSMVRAREAVLHQDLQTLRSAIDQFTLDKEKAPWIPRRLGAGRLLAGDSRRSDDPKSRLAHRIRERSRERRPNRERHHRRALHIGRRFPFRRHALQFLVGSDPSSPSGFKAENLKHLSSRAKRRVSLRRFSSRE